MKKILILICMASVFSVSAQRTARYVAPERLFLDGKEMFDMKNYSGAIDKLSEYKKQEKANADLSQEADFLIACCAYNQGLPQAAEMLKEYVGAYPDNRHEHEANYYIGSLHFGKGEYERALFWLNESDVDMLPASMQESHTYYLAFSHMQANGRYRQGPFIFRKYPPGGKRIQRCSSILRCLHRLFESTIRRRPGRVNPTERKSGVPRTSAIPYRTNFFHAGKIRQGNIRRRRSSGKLSEQRKQHGALSDDRKLVLSCRQRS